MNPSEKSLTPYDLSATICSAFSRKPKVKWCWYVWTSWPKTKEPEWKETCWEEDTESAARALEKWIEAYPYRLLVRSEKTYAALPNDQGQTRSAQISSNE